MSLLHPAAGGRHSPRIPDGIPAAKGDPHAEILPSIYGKGMEILIVKSGIAL